MSKPKICPICLSELMIEAYNNRTPIKVVHAYARSYCLSDYCPNHERKELNNDSNRKPKKK